MADRKMRVLLFLTAVSFINIRAHAREDHDHHAHEAHTHGAWELFAAIDGKQLSVTMKGPLVDVIGFENQPTDEEDYAAIEKLKSSLRAPQSMFAINTRAGCAISQPVEIFLPEGFDRTPPIDTLQDVQKAQKDGDQHTQFP